MTRERERNDYSSVTEESIRVVRCDSREERAELAMLGRSLIMPTVQNFLGYTGLGISVREFEVSNTQRVNGVMGKFPWSLLPRIGKVRRKSAFAANLAGATKHKIGAL